MVGRNGRHLQANLQEPSDSEDEPPPVRGYDPRESSEEEIANRYVADYPRNRRRANYQHYPDKFKAKLDIPFFDGHLHIEDFLDWEKAVENFFDYMEIEPDKQVKYVACRLKGGASAWWEQTLQMKLREARGAEEQTFY
ncbi:hypothetical protein KFK09_005839 [Dendrobium nobile]|uniref:Retrotransposon gag domain-containing protein n=1 Tax=Dendrobium nobile TaxID=94219 RepID=A0A8T3BWU8_DENNO|nr:hypothetical protein KFK09_005839 [Dendrobium nobile]